MAAFPLRAAPAPRPCSARRRRRRAICVQASRVRPRAGRSRSSTTLNAGPQTSALYLELARLQEARGAIEGRRVDADRGADGVPERHERAARAGRHLQPRRAVRRRPSATIEQVAAMQPGDPQAQHIVATFYEEKVRKDAVALARRSAPLHPGRHRGGRSRAGAESRPTSTRMIVKNILLRHQANVRDQSRRRRRSCIAEADQLRKQAIELQNSRRLLGGRTSQRRRRAGTERRDAACRRRRPRRRRPARQRSSTARRRSGSAATSRRPPRLVNVAPVYPPEAQDAGVQGVVIIEAIIDAAGIGAEHARAPIDSAARSGGNRRRRASGSSRRRC